MEKNTKTERWLGLIIGLLLNAMGQGLCIVGAMGSGIWTAAAINLNNWQGFNIGWVLIAFGFLNAVINQFLIRRLDLPRFIGEVLYAIFYGYFVNIFTWLFTILGVGSWPIVARAFVSCFGVFTFGVAISLYQRANIIMHPNDDTTNILRFKYLKGNATASQLIDFVPPVILIIISWIFSKQLLGINIATVFSMAFNGVIIAWSDEHIWGHLKHNFKLPENVKKIVNK
ncbi:hypothetical protein FC83_GL001538 [Agrilactobacillus composti DSM 18527 = JCM 14202]|uniref:Sugar specific permease n=1 Tax=Agrilactobacillus composti DSM 18527 = JCM 14202 TaxID=1423734 RepID=X0PDB8_9LACO|nr:hypothetical protein FC83_GL001538 [Agrilactobacillus composti DSM 18527 = JCM 14202]GAF38878.1 sugar specific permease [Agrilactobacillus composti DSM 18527 = JCM 14202]